MKDYSQYSKEELIQRIEELEKQLQHPLSGPEPVSDDFKTSHGSEILDILPDMLSIFDRDYNYVALASSEKTVHVGGNSENLLGKNLTDILPPDAYKPVKENFDKALNTGQPSIGYHNLYVDGKLENFENRVIPLDNQNHILCICRNISDRVRAQNQLQMVTSAVNNSLEEIYAVKTDGTLIFANKQFSTHYQLQEDLSSYKIYDILHQSPEEWNKYTEQLKDKGSISNYTIPSSPANGLKKIKEGSAFMLKDNTGEEIIWTIARDITERIRQEKKIRELNKLMETILNNIPVYLFVKDSDNDFRYLYWNKEFARVSKIPAETVIGKTDAEIFSNPEEAKKFNIDDQRLLENQQTIDFEEEYTTATGEKRIVHTIKTLVTLEDKKPLLIGIAWDITNQKMTEQELIKARIKAEEADKLKSAFLANMSHEIRTPLNAIVGFSKLMAETEETEERAQYADIIDKNTDLLLQLINDILDLSKIEAGMLEFTKKPIYLNELCQALYDTFLPRMPEKVRFILDTPDQGILVYSDSNRLAQVFSNLLNNAQKFTPAGEIHFGYTQEGKWIKCYVKDSGIGISPENLGEIFNRFVKLNTFIQGTGLGLPICRMIIENLGGEIHVESKENTGTIFHFTIPYEGNGETSIAAEKNSCKEI